MPAATFAASEPASRTWTARALSALVVAFMLFDTAIHLAKPAPVIQAFAELQIPEHLSVGIGVLELVCTVLYAVPRTRVLGAVLLTGYLGGATAIQVRAGAALFPIVFPSLLGVVLWGGLLLRDERVRALVRPSR